MACRSCLCICMRCTAHAGRPSNSSFNSSDCRHAAHTFQKNPVHEYAFDGWHIAGCVCLRHHICVPASVWTHDDCPIGFFPASWPCVWRSLRRPMTRSCCSRNLAGTWPCDAQLLLKGFSVSHVFVPWWSYLAVFIFSLHLVNCSHSIAQPVAANSIAGN